MSRKRTIDDTEEEEEFNGDLCEVRHSQHRAHIRTEVDGIAYWCTRCLLESLDRWLKARLHSDAYGKGLVEYISTTVEGVRESPKDGAENYDDPDNDPEYISEHLLFVVLMGHLIGAYTDQEPLRAPLAELPVFCSARHWLEEIPAEPAQEKRQKSHDPQNFADYALDRYRALTTNIDTYQLDRVLDARPGEMLFRALINGAALDVWLPLDRVPLELQKRFWAACDAPEPTYYAVTPQLTAQIELLFLRIARVIELNALERPRVAVVELASVLPPRHSKALPPFFWQTENVLPVICSPHRAGQLFQLASNNWPDRLGDAVHRAPPSAEIARDCCAFVYHAENPQAEAVSASMANFSALLPELTHRFVLVAFRVCGSSLPPFVGRIGPYIQARVGYEEIALAHECALHIYLFERVPDDGLAAHERILSAAAPAKVWQRRVETAPEVLTSARLPAFEGVPYKPPAVPLPPPLPVEMAEPTPVPRSFCKECGVPDTSAHYTEKGKGTPHGYPLGPLLDCFFKYTLRSREREKLIEDHPEISRLLPRKQLATQSARSAPAWRHYHIAYADLPKLRTDFERLLHEMGRLHDLKEITRGKSVETYSDDWFKLHA